MSRSGGFTLVELLAALVAGSLVMVALGWSLASLTGLLTRSAEERPGRGVAALAPVLAGLIGQAAPDSFETAPRRLAATVPPTASASAAGPLRMVLTIRQTAGGEELHAEMTPVAGLPWPAAARSTILARGFDRIGFTYAGEAQSGPPELVTLSFEHRGKVSRVSVRPRVDSDGACRFDPISMECRR